MIKQVSFVFAFLIIHSCYSQEFFQSNKIVKEDITYQSLEQNGIGRKIFSLIGSENNIDVRKISLRAKSRILIRISRDLDNRLTAKIGMTKVSLEGNTTIHAFNLDSLLWPGWFTAKLNLYNGRHKRDVITISGSTNGSLVIIDLTDNLSSSIGQISAVLSDLQFAYGEKKLQKLEKLTKTIDYYYSYALLLKDIIKEHNKSSVSNNQSTEKIFVDKIEINRISHFIAGHNFNKILNLESYDPADFLKSANKLKRLSQRAGTLFKQQLSNNESSASGPLDFCKLYCDISLYYLREAKSLQPADASGYEEVASIDVHASEEENIRLVTKHYSQNSSASLAEINQCIFDEFVNLAYRVMADKNYADAIILLNNALIIKDWFSTTSTPKYCTATIVALDGVASSYLRVGNGALGIQNIELATTYFEKADNIFEENRSMFSVAQLPDTAFNEYLELQYRIAMQYIAIGEFETAITRLTAGVEICTDLNNSLACKMIDSALCLSHSGNINRNLNRIEENIGAGQYQDARLQLFKAAQYLSDNNCLLTDENARFGELSYLLFLKFLHQGEILIEAQQSAIALENLLYAKSIQQFLQEDIIKLDRLLEFAVEPEIIELINEAKYHTWANRIDKAKSLYTKAIKLNEKYFSNNNSKINMALEVLINQMSSRKCISNEIKYADILKKIHIVVKNKQFKRLDGLLTEAELFRVKYAECNIPDKEVQEIKDKYSSVIRYYKEYDKVIDILFEEGYTEVIPLYITLIEFYNYNDLFHYDIYFPNLESFIINQKSPQLTMATANFYLKNGNTATSFSYVEIFKDQGGNSKSIKHITTDIAKSFAERDDNLKAAVTEMLDEYTSGDNWFSHFKVAYLKYRILNKVK